MSTTSGNGFNASEYRKRKAQRLEQSAPEWRTNPETGESFLLRKVGAMAAMIAGHMPAALTADAVQAWEEEGVEGATSEPKPNREDASEAERDMRLMARVVAQACVSPKLVSPATKDDELDPADLDDSDVLFIFRYATGQVSGVSMQGGQVMPLANLKSVRTKPRKRKGAGGNGAELQPTA